MRKTVFIIGIAILVAACHQEKKTHLVLDPAFRAAFGYQVGSYWVYEDSVSGEIDSFYVYSSTFETVHNNTPNESEDQMGISLMNYSSGPNNSEKWLFIMMGNGFSVIFSNTNKDTTETRLGFLYLFDYPFKLEPTGSDNDSGAVSNLYSNYSLNGVQYGNTIVSYHTYRQIYHPSIYSDYFFISETAGIIKVIFNHPTGSVYRVLKLKSYKIVK